VRAGAGNVSAYPAAVVAAAALAGYPAYQSVAGKAVRGMKGREEHQMIDDVVNRSICSFAWCHRPK
jgi:hypothetical protein